MENRGLADIVPTLRRRLGNAAWRGDSARGRPLFSARLWEEKKQTLAWRKVCFGRGIRPRLRQALLRAVGRDRWEWCRRSQEAAERSVSRGERTRHHS
ncbi:hypothetical protein AAFF_G00158430 [Aldrovandia affinis]|uniref:Uncharacterized protein n=1 Tax=Aldrovandia affinis TaxID=143900 RepID=A0AAD7RNH0_9TELE|nr:hypothetical protein AAFF_G00158430 [Aldrovandia affinis]